MALTNDDRIRTHIFQIQQHLSTENPDYKAVADLGNKIKLLGVKEHNRREVEASIKRHRDAQARQAQTNAD